MRIILATRTSIVYYKNIIKCWGSSEIRLFSCFFSIVPKHIKCPFLTKQIILDIRKGQKGGQANSKSHWLAFGLIENIYGKFPCPQNPRRIEEWLWCHVTHHAWKLSFKNGYTFWCWCRKKYLFQKSDVFFNFQLHDKHLSFLRNSLWPTH